MLCGFKWIIPGKLAGSGLPGLLSPFDEDMQFLVDASIKLVVTLTESSLAKPPESFGLEGLHYPIPDMGFPIPRDCEPMCQQVVDAMENGPVLLHCRAGLGRTGTIAACILVTLGASADEALTKVRMINPNMVQTVSQEQFIGNYANFLNGPKAKS